MELDEADAEDDEAEDEEEGPPPPFSTYQTVSQPRAIINCVRQRDIP